jgi:hypothetical protein
MVSLRAIGVRLLPLAGLVALGALGPTEPGGPVRFHDDPQAVLTAMLDVHRAFYRDDAAATREALDRLERSCRRLAPEDDARQGSDVVAFDRAYHVTLSRAREFSGAGDLARAFDEIVWVSRTCRSCHDFARRAGRLPEGGPLW